MRWTNSHRHRPIWMPELTQFPQGPPSTPPTLATSLPDTVTPLRPQDRSCRSLHCSLARFPCVPC